MLHENAVSVKFLCISTCFYKRCCSVAGERRAEMDWRQESVSKVAELQVCVAKVEGTSNE
jgi:hypothetical protein